MSMDTKNSLLRYPISIVLGSLFNIGITMLRSPQCGSYSHQRPLPHWVVLQAHIRRQDIYSQKYTGRIGVINTVLPRHIS